MRCAEVTQLFTTAHIFNWLILLLLLLYYEDFMPGESVPGITGVLSCLPKILFPRGLYLIALFDTLSSLHGLLRGNSSINTFTLQRIQAQQ
jgi:hypothetical protein